jgi:hypothetical protein
LTYSLAADNDEISANDLCPEDSNCPEFCYCEAGTVDCSHKGLKEIPQDLPKTTTRSLSFSKSSSCGEQ